MKEAPALFHTRSIFNFLFLSLLSTFPVPKAGDNGSLPEAHDLPVKEG